VVIVLDHVNAGTCRAASLQAFGGAALPPLGCCHRRRCIGLHNQLLYGSSIVQSSGSAPSGFGVNMLKAHDVGDEAAPSAERLGRDDP
jgi:hypothetical protein